VNVMRIINEIIRDSEKSRGRGVDVRKDRTKQDIIRDIQRAENRTSFYITKHRDAY
jgi:hypothetical protein